MFPGICTPLTTTSPDFVSFVIDGAPVRHASNDFSQCTVISLRKKSSKRALKVTKPAHNTILVTCDNKCTTKGS
ncbi:unnamed protein product [Ceratitis capitata]|uniref:(Mediterranean fruit fly) hypothetical protein n=1 Tax=Ceratitis capitata TaxID=7213 RepID=A0A811VHG1_CERCA|nr:unnamed protein product [Ceratitis capitata]